MNETAMRDKIAEIIRNARMNANPLAQVGYAEADALIANGVILPPCRCKDCAYLRESDKTNKMFCTYHGDYYKFETFPNHYCSQGVGLVKAV